MAEFKSKKSIILFLILMPLCSILIDGIILYATGHQAGWWIAQVISGIF
ncbi:hypothetical protein [Anaerococcus sp. AGMB09787]|nr:hypothetical protein [Anaerococcus sp. AGMB09787]